MMMVYRLARRGSIDHLTPREEPMPRPQRGEVVVRVRAVSLNYRDLALVHGRYFPDAPDDLVPVSDASGEITEVGEGVTRFAPGDRVINVFNPRWFGGPYPGTESFQYGTTQDGWLTQYKAVSEEHVIAMPPGMSYEQASTLPCAAVTAWSALTGPRPVGAADTVLTQGTGGVSLFAAQLAQRLGARVIATTSSPAKSELLKAIGVDEVIDYNAVPEWGVRARELTGGRGVDRVIEVGGAATFAQSLKAGNDNTEIDVIGFLGDGDWGVDFWSLYGGGFETLRKIRVGSRQDAESLVRFVAGHPIEPVVDRVYPFERTLDAWHHFDGGEALGKIVISL
ncbi:zinc-dependent alcohol dehydrogenase family protein [Herbidospora sp. RD11066]